MDPFIAGIAIHEASRNRVQQNEKEQQEMDPFIYEHTRIRHQERLDAALKPWRGQPTPSLPAQASAFVQRMVKSALALRISVVVRTQADLNRRSLTEPDVCIE